MNELNLPEEEAQFTKQEMDMAATLINQLTGEFDPGLYRDEYRVALEQVIEAKLTGSEPVTATPVSSQGKVGDLMDALRASIESTKSERSAKKPVAKKSVAESSEADKPVKAKKAKAKV